MGPFEMLVVGTPVWLTLGAPWMAGALLAYLAAAWHRRADARARPLLGRADRCLRHDWNLTVEMGDRDGYWPLQDTVVLTPGTATSRTVIGRAIALHEAGHALSRRPGPGVVLALRVGAGLSWAGASAGLVLGAIQGREELADASLGLALVAALLATAVAADEARASWWAWVRLAPVWRLDPGSRARVGQVFTLAWLGAAVPALLRWGVVVGWPALVHALVVDGRPLQVDPGPAATWLLLATPLLALRVGYGLLSLLRPESAESDFRVRTLASREASWVSGSALLAAGVVLAYPTALSDGWSLLAAWWALTLGLPVFGGILLGFFLTPLLATVLPAGGPPAEPPPVLARALSQPSWTVRGLGLLQLGWVPAVLGVLSGVLGLG